MGGHDGIGGPLQRGERLLRQTVRELGQSARAHDKVLRVVSTIADPAGEPNLTPTHPSEAIPYRRLDRSLSQPATAYPRGVSTAVVVALRNM
jgi:hypothetical protein